MIEKHRNKNYSVILSEEDYIQYQEIIKSFIYGMDYMIISEPQRMFSIDAKCSIQLGINIRNKDLHNLFFLIFNHG